MTEHKMAAGRGEAAALPEESGAAARRRLKFRAGHRGIREMDLLLGAYAEKHIAAMSAAELSAFEHILRFEDSALLRWFTGAAAKPRSIDDRLFQAILAEAGFQPGI